MLFRSFYYISTKWFSDGDVHRYFTPYDSPYEAFINYMNALSDFRLRVDNYAVTGLADSKAGPKADEVDFLIADYEAKLQELKSIKSKVGTKKRASVAKKAPVKKTTRATAKKVSTSTKATKATTAKKASVKKK